VLSQAVPFIIMAVRIENANMKLLGQ